MSLRARLALRILWILFGICAVVGGGILTFSGFSGGLIPAMAGFAWLVITLHMLFHVLVDILKAAGLALDIRDGGK